VKFLDFGDEVGQGTVAKFYPLQALAVPIYHNQNFCPNPKDFTKMGDKFLGVDAPQGSWGQNSGAALTFPEASTRGLPGYKRNNFGNAGSTYMSVQDWRN